MIDFSQVEHVCFDKDGTLIDVHAYWNHTSALRAARIRDCYLLDSDAERDIRSAIGIDASNGRIKAAGPVGFFPRRTIIESVRGCLLAKGVPATDQAIGDIFKEIDDYQQRTNDYRVEVLPGAAAFVSHLAATGTAISVYSSDRKANVQKVLDALPIGVHIRIHVGGDSVKEPKPHPEGFLVACELAGTTSGRSVYIGDTVDDLKMGLAARAHAVIGVATGLASRAALSAHTSNTCERLDQLIP